MRRSVVSLTAVLLVLLASAPGHALQAPSLEIEFEGGGWGHGVGLSQFGAYGMALNGASTSEIVAHYYSGTQIERIDEMALDPDPLTIGEGALWVSLLRNRYSVTFQAIKDTGPLDLCQAGDGTGVCPRAVHPQPEEVWTFEGDGGTCQFYREGVAVGPPGSCRASIVMQPGSRVNLQGTDYGRGEIKIRSGEVRDGFHVSMAISVEEYLYGLGEMYSSWSEAALQAQAIAGRTYATNRFLGFEILPRIGSDPGFTDDRKESCWCHIYGSTLDQAYVGWSKESEESGGVQWGAIWKAAVDDTANQVITYTQPGWESFTKQTVIQSFYFSSSAGYTDSNIDGFNSKIPYPYLVPVPDPGSQDPTTANPYSEWTAITDQASLATRLGWDALHSVVLVNGPPGTTVRFYGTDDGLSVVADKSAWWLRKLPGFRSGQITAINGIPPFTDIVGSPHTQNIITIWLNEVTKGCTVTQYCPNAPVTRGQMASFLARALDLPPASTDFFPDDNGSTHEDNINRVREAGIAQGFEDGTYRPADPVRRDHMATFLARASALEPVPGPLFTDVSGFHEGNINAIAAAGITLGCSLDGPRYCPADLVTRAQMASFLARAFFSG
ncbi:MAG: S-layer homology domain-containing protein [Acidimicrobiia bacterium]|nr:S-layer homology domain-containing protein [Acidimicrobiia bacterium]